MSQLGYKVFLGDIKLLKKNFYETYHHDMIQNSERQVR